MLQDKTPVPKKECLFSMHEILGLFVTLSHKLCRTHTYNPSTQEGKPSLEVQGHHQAVVAQPLIPILRRQRQVDPYVFKTSLVSGVSSRTGSLSFVLKIKTKQKQKSQTWVAV